MVNPKLKSGETESKVSLGYVTESFGPAHTLSISWKDAGTTARQWEGLRRCRLWQLSARYNPDDTATLTLKGQGRAVPVAPPQRWGGGQSQLHAIPVFEAAWELDAWGISFFMAGAKRAGFFILLPATDMQLVSCHRPIVAFLKAGRKRDD